MAETTTPIAANSAALPSADALFLFLNGLRHAGYPIDARHVAAAQCLLAEARADGVASPAARRFKFRLAPLIAKSPSQQQDFYRRFDDHFGSAEAAGRLVSAAPPPAGPATEVVKRDPRRRVIAGAVAAFLAVAAVATWYFWPPPSPSPPGEKIVDPPRVERVIPPDRAVDLPQEQFEIAEQVVSPFYAGLKAVLAAAPLFAFAAWFLVRWRRRLLLMSRGVVLGDAALGGLRLPLKLSDVLFAGPELRATAHDLRKHRYLPTHKLDAWRTVDATARRAGLFTPVYRERPQLPEYVFLIEQNGGNDHLARLFDLVVDRLRDEQVEIQRFYFHTDPRHVQADDRERSTVSLAELAARTDDHRLFIIATADGFFHPLTGEVESWVRRLDLWRARTLLSTRPLEQWTIAELRLLEEGFSLATAEASGFAAAGEKIAAGSEEAELLEGVLVMPTPTRPQPKTPLEPREAIPDFAVFRDIDAPWCPEIVALPGGMFLMGSPKSETERYDHEGPQHSVTIAYRFAIGRYPVTFNEYDHFCDIANRKEPDDQGWGRGRRPVINVSWRDAQAYVAWLAEATGKPYRLPSEAEWEYAARAGTTTRYAFGDGITEKEANFGGTVGTTTEVGAYPANAWGLHDMHGNVWEWVEDVWHDSYRGAPAGGSAWTGGEGKDSSRLRVYRGGSWSIDPRNLRSADRSGGAPDYRSSSRGFRVAQTLD